MERITNFAQSGYPVTLLHLFREVADAQALVADCPVVRLAAGETISEANNRGGQLYVVLRGSLNVEPISLHGPAVDGPATRILPGECVGELSVLDEDAAVSTISAVQETELLQIDADRLWQMIEESNGVARNLLRLLSFRVRAANAQLRRRHKVGEFYRQLSIHDGLTGLHNRAWLDDTLPALVAEAHSHGRDLALIMIDLDHFKLFNDSHGHQAGDEALKAAARVLKGALRPSDYAARYGGEEMTVILPGSNLDAAMLVAQRLCDR
ncbi:MAG: GGDEF domain-containing protein, partial [Burkholderiaceae bacterium]|nr:GGDEF domain-containing protein [Burkholderiaceae bacterium]